MSDADLARRALALLDLTDLADDATEAGTRELCRRAVSGPVPVAAVCLWPCFVATARAELGDGPVRIATVVNFPDGDTPIAPAMRETEEALAAGADEIDLVLPWRAVLAGQTTAAAAMVRNVKMLCDERRLKVILETGEYPDLDKVRTTSELAIAAGADFIKTSTGKTANSASIPAAVAPPTRAPTCTTPRTRLGAWVCASSAIAIRPNPATGWKWRGSPSRRSAAYPRRSPVATLTRSP